MANTCNGCGAARACRRRAENLTARLAARTYLCRDLVLPDGTVCPMLGILPASAVLNDAAFSPSHAKSHCVPVLGLAARAKRCAVIIRPLANLFPSEHALTLGQDAELIVRHQAIGSTLQLFPAASEELLEKFLTPCPRH